MSDNEYAAGDSGAANCTPDSAGNVKKGGYCMLKGFPCKVTEYSTAKPGKHGSAKATIVGTDIFTNKKYEDSWPTSAGVSIPIVTKQEYECLDIDEDFFCTLQADNGDIDSTLKLPSAEKDEELHNELMGVWNNRGDQSVLFSVISAVEQRKIVSGRTK